MTTCTAMPRSRSRRMRSSDLYAAMPPVMMSRMRRGAICGSASDRLTGFAVLAVYLAFFLTLAGIGVLLANPISNQVRTFTHNLPTIRNEANKRLATFQHELDEHGIHLHLVKQGQTALQSIESTWYRD